MSVFGNILKEKRKKMGYSIQDISEITTIQQRYIQALEDDNFENIPGEYYVRAFLKQYATILKMDSQKLIKKYEKYIVESNTKRPEVLLQDELRKPARPNEKDEDSEELNVISNKTSQEQEEVQEVTDANEMIEDLNNQSTEEVSIGLSVVEENEVMEEVVEVTEEAEDNLVDEVDEDTIEIENVIVLDSDGLDDELVSEEENKEDIVEELEETVEVPPIVYSENNEDVPTTKMNKKLVVLLSVMVVLMLALIWFIPNVMSSFAPKQTVTTTPSSTLAPTTTSTSTTQTTTAQTTAQTTTTTTTTQQTTATPRPTNEPADLYVISSDVAQTTYGLGRSFANYTGEYVVTLTATQPVWIRVEIFGQKVHEGTMTPNIPYRFNAYNNAGTMKIRVGLSSALSMTFNGQPVNAPTHQRVQEYTFNFAR